MKGKEKRLTTGREKKEGISREKIGKQKRTYLNNHLGCVYRKWDERKLMDQSVEKNRNSLCLIEVGRGEVQKVGRES